MSYLVPPYLLVASGGLIFHITCFTWGVSKQLLVSVGGSINGDCFSWWVNKTYSWIRWGTLDKKGGTRRTSTSSLPPTKNMLENFLKPVSDIPF